MTPNQFTSIGPLSPSSAKRCGTRTTLQIFPEPAASAAHSQNFLLFRTSPGTELLEKEGWQVLSTFRQHAFNLLFSRFQQVYHNSFITAKPVGNTIFSTADVISMDELTQPLTGCSTWKSEPCACHRQHSKADAFDRGTRDRVLGIYMGGPILHMPYGGVTEGEMTFSLLHASLWWMGEQDLSS